MRCLEVDAAEFVDQLLSAHTTEAMSVVNGVAAVFVDFRNTVESAAATSASPTVRAKMTTITCPVVAIMGARNTARASFAAACDVVLAEPGVVSADAVELSPARLDCLRSRAVANPFAAATLALLLRSSSGLEAAEALVAESTAYSLLQGGPEFRAWRERTPRRLPRPSSLEPVEAVRVERAGPELRITLARPHVHNAVNVAMRDGLAEALDLAAVDATIERVLIRGEGPSFSSGGDLDEFATFVDPVHAHLTRLTRSPAARLHAIADRVEVRLHGNCMGAGIELPAFARRVVAAPDVRIALPEVRYGLIPGAGGTVSVPRRIGRHRSAYLALTGDVIGAEQALAWGLVDAITA